MLSVHFGYGERMKGNQKLEKKISGFSRWNENRKLC